MDSNKKGRFIAAFYAVAFGGFTSYVIWNEWANRVFARALDFLCTPVWLCYDLIFGSNAACLELYFIACVVYMTGLGYALGHFLYKGVSKARRRTIRPQPPVP
jgi:hypothetical protein